MFWQKVLVIVQRPVMHSVWKGIVGLQSHVKLDGGPCVVVCFIVVEIASTVEVVEIPSADEVAETFSFVEDVVSIEGTFW